MLTLEKEFEIKKQLVMVKTREAAIGQIATYLKDYFLSHGVVLPADVIKKDANMIFECARLEKIYKDTPCLDSYVEEK